jgi:hypothetical protein
MTKDEVWTRIKQNKKKNKEDLAFLIEIKKFSLSWNEDSSDCLTICITFILTDFRWHNPNWVPDSNIF